MLMLSIRRSTGLAAVARRRWQPTTLATQEHRFGTLSLRDAESPKSDDNTPISRMFAGTSRRSLCLAHRPQPSSFSATAESLVGRKTTQPSFSLGPNRPGQRIYSTLSRNHNSGRSSSVYMSFMLDGQLVGFLDGSKRPKIMLGMSVPTWVESNSSSHHPAGGVGASWKQVQFFSTQPQPSHDAAASKPILPSHTLGTTRIPTPPSSPPQDPNPLEQLRQTTPKGILHKGMDLTVSLFRTAVGMVLRLPGNVWFYITHPDELRQAWAHVKQAAQDEVHHYWVGFKLLWAEMQTARKLLGRTLQGSSLTRRERKQLLRTVSDLFRLLPFSMFIIIPFMEFALPLALRLFPNMLPSTFQDSLKAEEQMKRELQSRIAMAQFFQETMEELAKEQKRKASKRKKELIDAGVSLDEAGDTIDKQEDSAQSMLEFLKKARNGEMIPPDVIIRYASYFQDDLTLDNMPRMQLINMCKYMNIPPYGSDAFLRFQLRHKIRVLKEDDQKILWEGIDSLTKMELREACQERGMRSTGLSKDAYKRSLQQWLDLSVNKNVPISLLIMSRTFFLRDEVLTHRADDESKSLAGLADAMSGLDKEVLDQVILEVATNQEKVSDPEIRKLKLEVVSKQNELIRQEQAARDAASKRKISQGQEKVEVPNQEKTFSDIAASPSATPETVETRTAPDLARQSSSDINPPSVPIEEERDLSTDEMDAISQLVSHDPVSKERAELARIKAAMRPKEGVALDTLESTFKPDTLADEKTQRHFQSEMPLSEQLESDRLSKRVADVPVENHLGESVPADRTAGVSSGTEYTASLSAAKEQEDPVVAGLKKRIESMVDKIEVQLSQAQVKIGDKLHYLDRDRDGVLSPEEMAEALQQVLKRKITQDEAMEIARRMDTNQDGLITVEELIKWIDEHKLVRFVEEGRDADMERVMQNQSSDQQKDDESKKEPNP